MAFLSTKMDKNVPVIKGIQVVYTSSSSKKPPNAIAEMYGMSADINSGFGGDYVWLVPIWTTNMTEGVTKIRSVVQMSWNSAYSDLAAGSGGDYRYLKMEKEIGSSKRIKSVGLLRSSKHIKDIREFGWDERTSDINENRGGNYLYLCWKYL
ncbi:uncharacterized protein LOC119071331 [Bradysia coprophila]|uniref:uncharacterized protein LOC119071331 n=1 Tax=Bradysia coprophila TaxID=38358 RepID=UPI00187D9A19|nr:uncharacterized protein LOC119071331 [Bradysia coprophila]